MDEIEKKEEWYLNIDYREAKEIIRNKLQGMTQNFIGIGFYLRQIKETEGFQKDGYASVYEFAEDQYGIKRSTAIRWMQMNEKFSQGGYSPFLDSGYKDFGKSQLQEMLYLDSEQLEEVTPEMTVREIREIRTPDPEPEEQLPGQMSVEDFPEVLPEREEQQTEETKVELQKPTKEQREYLNAFARKFIVIHRNWFLENYQNRVMNVTTSPILIRQKFCEGKDRTYYFAIREKAAHINLFDDYIQLWSENNEYMGDYDWFYLAAAIQSTWTVVAIEEAQQKIEEEPSEEVCDVAQSENTDCKPEQSSCPPGQTSCPRENWGTSDEDQLQGWRECAACWNHYKKLHEHDEEAPEEENVGIEIPQDIMEEVTELVEDYQEIPEENEPVIVEQPEGIAIVDIPSEPELYEEVSEKTDIDIAREENQKARMYLEMAEKEFGPNDIRIRKQKILVAALAGYIHDLDMVLNPPEEPEQPELPKLRNNDQRKEWLRNYKDWGLWYHDDRIDVNYYKYDFEDGSRLIVTEYPKRKYYWNFGEVKDSYYFHLLKKNKKYYGREKTYDQQYVHTEDSETHLMEFLKNLQKGEK